MGYRRSPIPAQQRGLLTDSPGFPRTGIVELPTLPDSRAPNPPADSSQTVCARHEGLP